MGAPKAALRAAMLSNAFAGVSGEIRLRPAGDLEVLGAFWVEVGVGLSGSGPKWEWVQVGSGSARPATWRCLARFGSKWEWA